jgi:hypothetical protein
MCRFFSAALQLRSPVVYENILYGMMHHTRSEATPEFVSVEPEATPECLAMDTPNEATKRQVLWDNCARYDKRG